MYALSVFVALLLVVTGVSAAAPLITPGLTGQTINEGQTFTDINLDDFVSDVEDTDDQLVWEITGNTDLVVNLVNRVVTVVPTSNWNGQETLTFKVTDTAGEIASKNLIFKANPQPDAPVLTSIGNQEVQEDHKLEITLEASDPDLPSDVLTYTATLPESLTGKSVSFDENTKTLTWTPTDDDVDLYENVIFTVTDSQGNSDSETISIRVFPGFCQADDDNNLEITDIDFDDDEYKPGDEVEVDVTVKAQEDLENVEVEVILFNLDNNKEIEDWKADSDENIDDGDDQDYTISFTIPNDEDIGAKDSLVLVAVAKGEDDDNDDHCGFDTSSIDIERENHDVYFKESTITPLITKPGDNVNLAVSIENRGTKNEDSVFVRVRNAELGWDERSQTYDLDKFSRSDNDAIVRLSLAVPENAASKTYQIEALVFFDDGDETNSEFLELRVENGQTSDVVNLDVTSDTQISASDETVSLHLIVNNKEGRSLNAVVDVLPGTWADPVTNQVVTLHEGENNLFYDLNVKELNSGGKNLVVRVKSPTDLFETKQTTLNFNVAESESSLTSSSVFWIIGDVVLVLLVLFLIKTIFFGGKKAE